MASDTLQPLNTLGPMPNNPDPDLADPAKKDYMEGRKFFQEGSYNFV